MLVKSQVKYIQSLSQKKVRDAEGVFIVEGEKMVDEMLAADLVTCKSIFASETWAQTHPHVAVPVTIVTTNEMERISGLSSPSSVLAICTKPVWTNTIDENGWILLLDGIQDPGNLGTIIRNADWFNVQQIVCSEGTADCFNPKVVQASMGGIVRVNVQYADLTEWCQQHPSIPKYAAILDGTPIQEISPTKTGALIIGNESKGISTALLQQNVIPVTIPRKGGAESLNAAVATGILLSYLT